MMRMGRRVRSRRMRVVILPVIIAGVVGLSAGAADPPPVPRGVALNEVNCTGTDWVEVINRGNAEVSLAGWLLTDDALDRVPLRDSHRMRFGADAVLEPGARLVVSQGRGASRSGSRAATTRCAWPTPPTRSSMRSRCRCWPPLA